MYKVIYIDKNVSITTMHKHQYEALDDFASLLLHAALAGSNEYTIKLTKNNELISEVTKNV